jgi:hypothetical protein
VRSLGRGTGTELSVAGCEQWHATSNAWVGLPGRVSLPGLTLHKSGLGDRVRVTGLVAGKADWVRHMGCIGLL